jgi:hypothetical protein
MKKLFSMSSKVAALSHIWHYYNVSDKFLKKKVKRFGFLGKSAELR